MYEHDMSNEEIIAREMKYLNDTIWKCYEMLKAQADLTRNYLQEISDVLRMILENQNQAYILAEIKRGEICNRIGCNHSIDYHTLFSGCQVSECECEQFYRKDTQKL